jgi:hypothetical protein
MNSILIIVLAFVILFILQNIINNRMGINDVLNKNKNEVITKYIDEVKGKKQKVNKYIKDKSKTKVEYEDPFYKFPDPMLSNISHPLSAGYKPLFQNTNDTPNMSNVEIIRSNAFDNYKNDKIFFQPELVKKDTMDADPGNYTMQALAKKWDGEESEIKMTSDEYLTKYPKYADSNIMNELTNVGYFFDNDENNNFINIKDKILPDNCNLNGDKLECKFNGKLQQIPDKLMKNDSRVLNNIGVLIDDDVLVKSTNDFSYDDISGHTYKTWHYPDEKPMNGGVEFNDVYASNPMGHNENYMTVENRLNCSTCAI